MRSDNLDETAPGVSLHLDSYTNNLDTGQSSLGYGSVLSTGQDVGLAIGASTTTFYGPSGFTAAFTASGSSWTSPAGINADLVHKADGTWTLTYHATGEILTFSSGGYLTKDTDRNGVGLSLTYDSGNRVTCITDAAGRVTQVAYGSNGDISTITDPYGRQVTYAYDANAGTLTSITYADGAVLTYSGSDNLDSVQDLA